MSLIMMKTSQLPPLAFALYKTYCPAGISVVAGLMQQQVHHTYLLLYFQRRVVIITLWLVWQEL